MARTRGIFSRYNRCMWWGELMGWPNGQSEESALRCFDRFGRTSTPTGPGQMPNRSKAGPQYLRVNGQDVTNKEVDGKNILGADNGSGGDEGSDPCPLCTLGFLLVIGLVLYFAYRMMK